MIICFYFILKVFRKGKNRRVACKIWKIQEKNKVLFSMGFEETKSVGSASYE